MSGGRDEKEIAKREAAENLAALSLLSHVTGIRSYGHTRKIHDDAGLYEENVLHESLPMSFYKFGVIILS